MTNIFLINLLSRPDRLEQATEELDKYNFFYQVLPAIKKENGAEGLVETMKALFTHVLNSDRQRILVFEDDIKFLIDPNPLFGKCVDELPPDFHLFYLGLNPLLPLEKHTEHLLTIRAAYATHAILYSREAIELILPHLKQGNTYDQVLMKQIQPLGKCYCSYPMIATQRDSPSDIADFDEFAKKEFMKPYLDFETKTVRWSVLMEERYAAMTKNI